MKVKDVGRGLGLYVPRLKDSCYLVALHDAVNGRDYSNCCRTPIPGGFNVIPEVTFGALLDAFRHVTGRQNTDGGLEDEDAARILRRATEGRYAMRASFDVAERGGTFGYMAANYARVLGEEAASGVVGTIGIQRTSGLQRTAKGLRFQAWGHAAAIWPGAVADWTPLLARLRRVMLVTRVPEGSRS